MTRKTYLVTGGTGFLGSAVVRRLVADGHRLRVLDDNSRGRGRRLADVADRIEFVEADVRDTDGVTRAAAGVDSVLHLAYVNGTEFFYSKPDLVLDVGVRGMLAVIDACKANHTPELVLASSSEVYQTPPTVPTDETAPLSVPDPLNARYSYGGGKLICELMALHQAAAFVPRVLVFRPHNVYGPDMGNEHVVPQFCLRMAKLVREQTCGPVEFPIQGTGAETRAFTFIDDLVAGVMTVLARGEHRNIYHVGTDIETNVADLARQVGLAFGRDVRVKPGPLQPGGTPRRCPDIGKLRKLGSAPTVSLADGLARTVPWYRDLSLS
jgi:nucleoside-diphosphate-sugar epimerase